MLASLAGVALGVAVAPQAWAAYPLVVDDAGVYAPGESEWVVSADALRTPAAESLAANFSVAAGVWPGLELGIGTGYGWTRDRRPNAPTRDGGLDVAAGFKAVILAEDAAPFGLSISATAKLPTASARLGLGTGFTDANVLLIATRSWGELSVDLNAGFTWTAVGSRRERNGDAWFTGAALRYQASPRLLLFAETYASLPTDGTTEATGAVRAGWQLELRRGVLLGNALGTGWGPGAPEALGTLGVTFVF